jgi:hypothetical protein
MCHHRISPTTCLLIFVTCLMGAACTTAQSSPPGAGGSGGAVGAGGRVIVEAIGGSPGRAGSTGAGGSPTTDAGGSAGTGGGTDGGTGGGRTLAFQDNFESYPAGTFTPPAAWDHVSAFNDPPQPTNLAVIDTTRSHAGSKAIKVGPGFIGAAVPATAFYARVFAWFDANPGDNHWWSFYGYTATAGNKDGIQVRFGGQGGKIDLNYNSPSGEVEVGGRTPPDPGVALPTQRWACFEFYFGVDELRVWIDSAEVTAFHVTTWPNNNPPTPWSPTYQRFRIGYSDVGGGGTTGVWFDDFALDPQRIGCN